MTAPRWSPEQLAAYEAKVGRQLKTQKAAEVKPTKYHATRVEQDGESYQSKKERDRHVQLKHAVRLGEVKYLVRHPVFRLAEKVKQEGEERATPALRYEADFMYVKDGELVVEDVKGMKTRVYKMKRHLMKTVWGISILET